MIIQVITDCLGVKQDAIKGVFSAAYKSSSIEIIQQKGVSFQTPLTQDDFFLVTLKRMQQLRTNAPHPDHHFATIQKGYYYAHGLWYLSVCVSISFPLLNPLCVMGSSVPVSQESSEKKSKDLSKNMSDILAEDYPEWDKNKDSAYELLTKGEKELDWLQEPLRHCAKFLNMY